MIIEIVINTVNIKTVNKYNLFIFLFLFTTFSFSAKAQTGANDFTFNPSIPGFGNGANNDIRSTAIQSDGRIIIGGNFTSYNETAINRIGRINADGSLDLTFNTGVGANSFVTKTIIQNDGKIIISGLFTSYNGIPRNRIARLNTDGSLDGTFNSGTGANNDILTTAIQSDGKIIIGGYFTSYNGTPRNHIARLNADGTLDNAFNPGTGEYSYILSIAIQSNGEIIIGGDFTSYNGTARNHIARLNIDGTLDDTFNPESGTNGDIVTITIQSDEKIIIGGYFTSYNNTVRN
ncbi:MAG: delta-60 repeat domain-containing protein, partial [Bacteroidota bacterium]|nr:delta-60 repeat domain-containing protein [Bacteroidota bacterium]